MKELEVDSKPAKTKPGRRDKLYIMASVLETCVSGAKKTKIMYTANLSFSQLTNYIAITLEHDLLAKQIDDKGRAILRATPKGLDFLQKYDEISQILASENGQNKNRARAFSQRLRKIRA